MSGLRPILVGIVATLSLLGTVGAVQAAAPESQSQVSANRWCC